MIPANNNAKSFCNEIARGSSSRSRNNLGLLAQIVLEKWKVGRRLVVNRCGKVAQRPSRATTMIIRVTDALVADPP